MFSVREQRTPLILDNVQHFADAYISVLEIGNGLRSLGFQIKSPGSSSKSSTRHIDATLARKIQRATGDRDYDQALRLQDAVEPAAAGD